MRILIFATALLFINSYIYAQDDKNYYFELDGTINADSGIIKLELYDLKEYYPEGIESYTVLVNNNKFHIKGKIL